MAQLAFMEGANTARRRFQRLTPGRGEAVQGRLKLGLGQFQSIHTGHGETVETVGVFHHRLITPGLHVRQNGGHGPIDLVVLGRFKGQQGVEPGLKIRRRALQTFDGNTHAIFSTAWVKTSRMGPRVSRFSFRAA